MPDDPAVYCYFPSQLDPSLAPEGFHTCTIFSHYFPSDIPAGKHNEMKELMVERMLGQIEKVVPDFRDLIMDQVVFTQQYFEKTFGATEGDFSLGPAAPGPDVRRSAGPGLGQPRDAAGEPLHGRRRLPSRSRGDLSARLNGARVVLARLGGGAEAAASAVA